MKIIKKSSKKSYIILAIIAVLLIGGFIAWKVSGIGNDRPSSENSSTTSNDSKENSTDSAEQTSRNAADKQNFLDSESKSEDSTATTPPPAPTNDSISLAARSESDTVIITTKLKSVSSGTCTITITGGAEPFSQTAEVIYTPEYSTCAGFSVKKSSVSAKIWNISLTVKSGSSTVQKTINFTP